MADLIESYIQSIVKADARAYAEHAVAELRRIEAEHPDRHYIHSLIAPPFDKEKDDYLVSWKVGECITRDLNALLKGYDTNPPYYERHLRKQLKAQAKRRRTMQDRKETPWLYEVRDSQRSKLYSAERMSVHGLGQKWTTVPEMQAYVDKLVGSAWFKRRWSARRITVKPGFGHRNATGGNGVVQMPKWSRTEPVLLHEIAHVVTLRKYGGTRSIAAHGREFAAAYLELVEHCIGKEAAVALKAAYRDRKVRFRNQRNAGPTTRTPMSDEDKAALVERLRQGRERAAARAQGAGE